MQYFKNITKTFTKELQNVAFVIDIYLKTFYNNVKRVAIMEETKRDKFVRLAESRVNNALKQIELIGNLSNTRAYEYTKNDVEDIIKTLKNAVSDLEHIFKMDSKSSKFTLKR